jgi:hypothetical protein
MKRFLDTVSLQTSRDRISDNPAYYIPYFYGCGIHSYRICEVNNLFKGKEESGGER